MKRIVLVLLIIFRSLFILAQNRYDVVIDEIMADPSPQVGLPNNEWIEVKNISTVAINLLNWRISDASSQSGPLPNFLLQPDSFVVICSASAFASMAGFGTCIPVSSFPSLDNDGDLLFIKTATGKTIHAISYSSSWYKNELKKEGGWTLEMIDTKNPCTGMNNWKASININGGTPCRKNSIDGLNNDNSSSELKRSFTTDSITIIIVFDKPLDSLSGATVSNYTIDKGLSIISAVTLGPLFDQVQLKTSMGLIPSTVYTITAQNIKDCKGNTSGVLSKVKTGLPTDPGKGEWIINEILFNPRSNAFDYVEFFNNSNRIFDAAKLFIANRNNSGIISSIKALSSSPFYIFPGDYIVVTEDPGNLSIQYLISNPDNILTILSPPSFPDDEGIVIALNAQGFVVDEVKYKDYWHFKLVADPEGVSLERIDPAGNSNDRENWHSAASTAGYGTPGYKNSQYKLMNPETAIITVSPKIFSPDNDGHDDIASIQYSVDSPGYISNIVIYNAGGTAVRYLVKNGLLGLSGYWNWDGLDDKRNKLPVGTYVIFAEIFNLAGKKEIFKKVVVIARKL